MKRTTTIYPLTRSYSRASNPSTEVRRRTKAVSPSESAIRNLLNYSKALAVLKTTETGFINLVMN